mgnify:CR=1 FL=1
MTTPQTLCKCLMCGHEWLPRVLVPRRCPVCLSYKWRTGTEPPEREAHNESS